MICFLPWPRYWYCMWCSGVYFITVSVIVMYSEWHTYLCRFEISGYADAYGFQSSEIAQFSTHRTILFQTFFFFFFCLIMRERGYVEFTVPYGYLTLYCALCWQSAYAGGWDQLSVQIYKTLSVFFIFYFF